MSSKRHRAAYAASVALIAGLGIHAGCHQDTVQPSIDPPDVSDGDDPAGVNAAAEDDAGSTSSSSGQGGATSSSDSTSGVGGIMGGGGAPIPSDGQDNCASADAYSVDHGFSMAWDGNTLAATGSYASPCELSSGPEEVYQLDVAAEGTASIVVYALDGQDLSFYLRTDCEDPASATLCRNHDDAMTSESFVTSLQPGTHFLFVDTEGTAQGQYQVSLVFNDGQCGDGAVNDGEECDDGNIDPSDGCDASCALEPGSNDTCADAQGPVLLSQGQTVLTGNTLGNTDGYGFDEAGCGVVNYGGTRERVIALRPQISGEATLKLGYDASGTVAICEQDIGNVGCWDRVMHVRHAAGDASASACAEIGNQIACDAAGDWPTYVQELTIDVEANETYFVFIDSFWDGGTNPGWASGPYNLHIDLSPAPEEGGGAGGGGGGGGAGGAGGGAN